MTKHIYLHGRAMGKTSAMRDANGGRIDYATLQRKFKEGTHEAISDLRRSAPTASWGTQEVKVYSQAAGQWYPWTFQVENIPATVKDATPAAAFLIQLRSKAYEYASRMKTEKEFSEYIGGSLGEGPDRQAVMEYFRNVRRGLTGDVDPDSQRSKLEKEYQDLEAETKRLDDERDALDDRLGDGFGSPSEKARMNNRITQIDGHLRAIITRKSAIRRQLGIGTKDGEGEYGVRYRQANKSGVITNKEKSCATQAQLDAFVKKVENEDGFIEFTAWLSPKTKDADEAQVTWATFERKLREGTWVYSGTLERSQAYFVVTAAEKTRGVHNSAGRSIRVSIMMTPEETRQANEREAAERLAYAKSISARQKENSKDGLMDQLGSIAQEFKNDGKSESDFISYLSGKFGSEASSAVLESARKIFRVTKAKDSLGEAAKELREQGQRRVKEIAAAVRSGKQARHEALVQARSEGIEEDLKAELARTQDSPPKLDQQPWVKMDEAVWKGRAQTAGYIVKPSHWGYTATFEGYQAGEWTKGGVGWLAEKPVSDATYQVREQPSPAGGKEYYADFPDGRVEGPFFSIAQLKARVRDVGSSIGRKLVKAESDLAEAEGNLKLTLPRSPQYKTLETDIRELKSLISTLKGQWLQETMQGDALNHLGEREYQTYGAWRAAAKAAGATRFEGDKDIAHAVGADGKHVGEWLGDKGSIYTKDASNKQAALGRLRDDLSRQEAALKRSKENYDFDLRHADNPARRAELKENYEDFQRATNNSIAKVTTEIRRLEAMVDDADPWRVTIRVKGKNLVMTSTAATAEAAQLAIERRVKVDYGEGVDYNVIRVERSSDVDDAAAKPTKAQVTEALRNNDMLRIKQYIAALVNPTNADEEEMANMLAGGLQSIRRHILRDEKQLPVGKRGVTLHVHKR